jgi:mRNA-degrading endonuclease RelE of RelBE toxin-antitoxin system
MSLFAAAAGSPPTPFQFEGSKRVLPAGSRSRRAEAPNPPPCQEGTPRPRGYDKVEGAGGIYRVWVGRDWRLLYSIDQQRSELVIEAVRKKHESTYRQS